MRMFFNALLGSSGTMQQVPQVPDVPKVYTVWNEGIGGNNTSDVLNRMTSILAHAGDLHIIMLGTNDWRHPTPSKRRTSAQYKTNLNNIIGQILNIGSDVILMSFPPINEAEQTFDNITAAPYLTAIDELVISRGVHFVDQWAAFEAIGQPTNAIDSYMQCTANVGHTDGVHPTAVGAGFIAQNIIDYMVINNITTYTKIVCVGDSITRGDGLTGAGTVTGDTYPSQFKTAYADI